jgi:hypothetical protein
MHDLLLMGIPNLITRQVTGVFWSFMVYPRLGVGRFLVNYCWLHSNATPKGRSRTKFTSLVFFCQRRKRLHYYRKWRRVIVLPIGISFVT